jgi:hypothetical protein
MLQWSPAITGARIDIECGRPSRSPGTFHPRGAGDCFDCVEDLLRPGPPLSWIRPTCRVDRAYDREWFE